MPNNNINNIISQKQIRKAIRFRVAAAQGNLLDVQKYCDAYTLNSRDAKDNTALHLASEKGHNEIIQFLFQQPRINFHPLNAEDKKAVDLINQRSTAKLWQELLVTEKNLVQASVLRQKYLLKKSYDFILNNENNANESFTLEDLSRINLYVKQTLIYGAPDWKQEKFPHQQATCASLWKKKQADYYRIDILQDLLCTIENELTEISLDFIMRLLIIRIIHSSLAEVLQVGRCYEYIAVAFDQLLIYGKKAYLTWIQAENLKWQPTESLKITRSHSFIILDKVGGEKPETWESGLLMDPLDDKIASLKECSPQLMESLTRIINQPDREQIQLYTNLISSLPLEGKQHAQIAENLERLRTLLKGYFDLNWHLYWPEMKKNYPSVKERMVKTWLEKLWDVLAKKVDIHAAMADKMHLYEVQDSLTRLEQRFEIVSSAEILACGLNKQMKIR
ncbi:hypothetical protein [Rickettsiella endosymbiont of Xylota segnis]|uniref:hypothetical protein n=1 Tax=Rickettsiella endosymbiont of Xylota segnis TaxID=3066238 RepID=UPI0030D49593